MAEYQYIGEGRADGAIVFSSASKKGAFFGKTPIVQPSGAAQAAVAVSTITTAATTTTPWGFATSTQADALAATVVATRALVNQLRSDIVALGLIKGAA